MAASGPASDHGRYARIRVLFDRAMDLLPEERSTFLDGVAAEDSTLADEVRALLGAGDVARTNMLSVEARALRATPNHQGDENPKQIGPYRIIESLSRGMSGMGEVYKAERLEPVHQVVAIKVIKRGLASGEVLARFDLERRVLAAMNHDSIARVFDAGSTEEGEPYFVMEFVEGLPITTYCEHHRLSLSNRLELFQQVCHAVHHAHQKGIVHRDLKPGNVLVAQQGGKAVTKILDFGLAKAMDGAAAAGVLIEERDRVVGTLEYMAPEQAAGRADDIDVRTDVYALGVMLYELLTGSLPFTREQLRTAGSPSIRQDAQEFVPPRPSTRTPASKALRGDLDWIVLKAMAMAPEDRYVAATALADDLARHLEHSPVLAAPDSSAYRLKKSLRRFRGQVVAVTAVVITAVVGAATAIGYAMDARQQAANIMRLAAARDHANMITRAERLWPIDPDRIHDLNQWIHDARRLTDALPTHHQQLAALRAKGQLDSGAPATGLSDRRNAERWTFDQDDSVTPWWHAQLTTLVRDLERLDAGLLSDDAITPRHGMSIPARAEMARRLAADFAADGTATKAWQASRDAITKRYPGLDLEPQFGLVPIGFDPQSGLMEFAHITSGEVPTRDNEGRLELDEDSAIVLVLLPGGTFTMGASPEDRLAEPWEHPAHDVTVTPFFLGKHEITQAQWQRLSGDTPSYFGPEAHTFIHGRMHPVESVPWDRAREVLARFSLELPREAQWEYAARAGTKTRWWSGDSVRSILDVAGVSIQDKEYELEGTLVTVSDGFQAHAPVNSCSPNPWGFFMMCGNVFEWCEDSAASRFYERSTGKDPVCRAQTEYRITRGSAHTWDLERTRSSARKAELRTTVVDYVGVRAMRFVDRLNR